MTDDITHAYIKTKKGALVIINTSKFWGKKMHSNNFHWYVNKTNQFETS